MYRNVWNKSVYKTKPWSHKISWRKGTTIIDCHRNKYYQLYPTGSCAGKFYGTAKIHKLLPDGSISNLPLRPIISNISTASYQLAKNLAQLLSPLNGSGYTVNSMKGFKLSLKMKRYLKTAT